MVIIGLLIGLIVCVAPIATIILIITAIARRNKDDKNNFTETIRNIYVYIILIMTLITIISGVIYTFKLGLDMLLPEKDLYESSYSNEQIEMNNNIIEFCTTIALVVAVIPVFIYHNRLSKKSRERNVEEIQINEINN